MTINRNSEGDSKSARRALRTLIADAIQPDDPEAREAAQHLLGRADALELIREVVVEERLLRGLRAETSAKSEKGREPEKSAPPRRLPALSPVTGTSSSRAGRPWRMMAIAAAALLAVGLGLNRGAPRALLRAIGVGGAPEYRVAATSAAQLDTVELPDGSRAILAPNSVMRYAIASRKGARDVKLVGEAYFDVHHDEARPFRVETRHAVVTDLGTTFVVREYAADRHARVAVRSGAASLQAHNDGPMPAITMHSGDGAYVDARGAIARFSADPETYWSWTGGKLAFDATALPEVLAQLGRWYDVQFRLNDSTLSMQYFTGEFRSIPLSDLLAVLGPVVHARFERQGRVVVVTARPAGR